MKQIVCMLILVIVTSFSLTTKRCASPKNQVYEKKFYSDEELELFLERLFLKNDVPIVVGNIKNEDILKFEYYSYRVDSMNPERLEQVEKFNEVMDNNQLREFETSYKDINEKFTVLVRVNTDPAAILDLEKTEIDRIIYDSNNEIAYTGKIGTVHIFILFIFNNEIDQELAEEVKELIINNLKLYERTDFYEECLRPEPFC